MRLNNGERRVDETGFGGWIALSDKETAAFVLTRAASLHSEGSARSASASDDHIRFVRSVEENSPLWRQVLLESVADLPQERKDIIGLALATSASGAGDFPNAGAALRRADAILDLLDVGSAAAEVQAAVEAIGSELVGGPSTTGDQVRNLARKVRVGADFLTVVHPIAGIAAGWGLDRLGDGGQEGNVEAAETVDAVLALARTVAAFRFVLEDNEDRKVLALKVRDDMWDRAHSLGWTGVPIPAPGSQVVTQVKDFFAVFKTGTNQNPPPPPPSTGLEENPNAVVIRSLIRAASILEGLAGATSPSQPPFATPSGTSVPTSSSEV